MTKPTLEFEYELLTRGYELIVAVDEVGRGAIAGPVSVAAGLWRGDLGAGPEGIRDSKLVPESARGALASSARGWLESIEVGHCDATTVDREGITAALGIAGTRALTAVLEGLSTIGNAVIVLDGHHDWLSPVMVRSLPVVTKTKADRDCQSVAAASLVAKVTRDELMVEADTTWPEYGFARHKGYASPAHLEAINRLGPCEIHRLSWLRPPELFARED